MEALCRRMFFNSLSARPVDVDDVYQESALRLWKSLSAVQPGSAKDFFGLAAQQIRRVLIDFARKYAHSLPVALGDGQTPAFDPASLEIWTRFHEEVETLPEDLKEVVELLWYHELTQEEAAGLLDVDKSTVKRRWRRARTQLVLRLHGCI
jgi:RNA polymerase sigma-70 factor (ECF subfamily)